MAAVSRARTFGWWQSIVAAVAVLAVLAVVSWVSSAVARAAPGESGVTLSYHGGPVLHSSRPYLIFWTPAGESIAASSEGLIERFFTDAAADSGTSSNLFGVLRQYYDRTGFADYQQRFSAARQVITDRQPYPPRDSALCPDVSTTYPTCISDTQLESEVRRLVTAERLPTAETLGSGDLRAYAPIYVVILPADVEFCHVSGTRCSAKNVAGYHGAFTLGNGSEVLFAPVAFSFGRDGAPPPGITGPCALGGTKLPQEPNQDPADCTLNAISHEDSETITDPVPPSGWSLTPPFSTAVDETGDWCEVHGAFDPNQGLNPNAFLPTLGGSESAGTLYDQLIHGHPYYLQAEWSEGLSNCAQRPTAGSIAPRFTVARVHRVATMLSFDPAASTTKQPLSSATWNFGDGSPTGFFSGKAALTPTQHGYHTAGRYTVTLTLVDDRGNLDTATHTVVIR